jgi:hypothetical protein
MNVQEFSTEFDVLYNNITSNQAPGLNEYEKSVFLTKAQSQLINEYFNQRTDGVWGGFDGSQRRQYDFSSLIKVASLVNVTHGTNTLDRRGIVFVFPEDYFLSVNEVIYDGSYQYSVLPINYAEYQRLMLKPYNFPVKRAAWRLFKGKEAYNKYSDEEREDGIHARKCPDYSFALPAFNRKKTRLTIKVDSGVITPTEIWTSSITTKVDDPKGGQVLVKLSPMVDTTTHVDYNDVTINLMGTWTHDNDDNDFLSMIQQAFIQAFERYNRKEITGSAMTISAGFLLDWLQEAKAPINQTNFLNGKTIITEIVDGATSAEIIGKFKNAIKYQLRYVPKLKPIILEDLDNYGVDLTIDGEDSYSECILPEETHREILERAVTLAKIAWQGGTMTQATQAAQQQDRR